MGSWFRLRLLKLNDSLLRLRSSLNLNVFDFSGLGAASESSAFKGVGDGVGARELGVVQLPVVSIVDCDGCGDTEEVGSGNVAGSLLEDT